LNGKLLWAAKGITVYGFGAVLERRHHWQAPTPALELAIPPVSPYIRTFGS